jgi:YggT family protein
MNLAITGMHIVDAVAFVLYILIFVRILLSWFPISPWHPLVRLLRSIVDPILRPFRRILPTFGGIDFSPLLAIIVILLVQSLLDQFLGALAFGTQIDVAGTVVAFILLLIERIIIILGILVLIRLLLSLFSADPWHPLVMGVRTMTNPLVRPFAGIGPRRVTHGLDVPALATLLAYAVLYVVIAVVITPVLLGSI